VVAKEGEQDTTERYTPIAAEEAVQETTERYTPVASDRRTATISRRKRMLCFIGVGRHLTKMQTMFNNDRTSAIFQ
jgi:hypothetical protein